MGAKCALGLSEYGVSFFSIMACSSFGKPSWGCPRSPLKKLTTDSVNESELPRSKYRQGLNYL